MLKAGIAPANRKVFKPEARFGNLQLTLKYPRALNIYERIAVGSTAYTSSLTGTTLVGRLLTFAHPSKFEEKRTQ